MSTVEPPREDRPEWRETDEWIVPASLREPQTTTMPPLRGDGGEKR